MANQNQNYTMTPQEWEQKTGNKLLSYRSADGKLDMFGPKSYTRGGGASVAINQPEQPKSQPSMIGDSFSKMGMGSSGGFYGSMQGLEAASMRLADAAAKREQSLIGARGSQERSLQKLRGQQELDLLKRKYDLETEAEKRLEAKSAPRKEGSVTPLPDRPGYGRGDNGLLYRKIGGNWYLSL